MKTTYDDILNMLDYLNLTEMSANLDQMMQDPSCISLPNIEFLRQVVTDEYLKQYNTKTAMLIKLSSTSTIMGDIKQLYSHDGRIYNEGILEQVKKLLFLTNKRNVCVFGKSGAGKTYMLVGLCHELCAKGVKCLYADYVQVMDKLNTVMTKDSDLYYKRFKKYALYPVLVFDDFLSGTPSAERTATFFQLLKERERLGNPTIIGTQYDPEEWTYLLSAGSPYQGDADAVRRRLVDNAYLVIISKEG